MKLVIWLLDLNEETTQGRTEIHLWAHTNEGNSTLVIDRNLQPYVYLLLDGKRSINEVVEAVEKATQNQIEKIESVQRRYYGREVGTLKLTVKNTEIINKYASHLAKLPGVREVLEDDLRHSQRYLIHHQARPCHWHEIEVKESERRFTAGVDYIYEALSPPSPLQPDVPPNLLILAFHMVCYSQRGTPRPERDPITVISTFTNRGERRQFIAKDMDDKEVLTAFIEYVNSFNPDIITTYGGNSFEWPYLLKRARQLGILLNVGRALSEPHTSTYGHFSITGRVNLDLADFVDEFPQVKVRTLENMAVFLRVVGAKAETIQEVDYPSYWVDVAKRPRLLAYSERKAEVILKTSEKILDYAQQLSSLSGLPLDQVGPAAIGFRTESYLMREAHNEGELIPKRVERTYVPYQGAVVLKPTPGLHEDVIAFDFKSMYPTLMVAYNISPDTYVDPHEKMPEEQTYVAPEVGHRFRKSPQGLYPKVLIKLMQARDEIRQKMREQRTETYEYSLLDARQRAIKLITNATYGYAGWTGARWYLRPVAEAVAAYGRQTITRTIQLAESMGLEVIYGDTDSLFIKMKLDKAEEFQKKIEAELGLEIRPEEVYLRIYFTEAKKRYAGLLHDGSVNIVGLEVARGDWSEVAKRIQEEVLRILLCEKSVEQAVRYVKKRIIELRNGKTSLEDLVIWKTLTKPPEEYEVKAPHVEAARRLIEDGWTVTAGDKVGFVIKKGAGKLYDRAVPYIFASTADIDLAYYEKQQVLPAVLRILEPFKVTEAMLAPD